MRVLATVLWLVAGTSAAQKPTSAPPEPALAGSVPSAAVAAWRTGLEVSVNGSAWDRALTVVLTKAQCPPSTSSPCALGSAVGVDVRFPDVALAADLTKTRAQIGEPPAQAGGKYEVRLVRDGSSPLCAAGFVAATPHGAPPLAVNVGAPGPPLPLTCRWTALVGVSEPRSSSHVTAVWSDTVVVRLTSKP